MNGCQPSRGTSSGSGQEPGKRVTRATRATTANNCQQLATAGGKWKATSLGGLTTPHPSLGWQSLDQVLACSAASKSSAKLQSLKPWAFHAFYRSTVYTICAQIHVYQLVNMCIYVCTFISISIKPWLQLRIRNLPARLQFLHNFLYFHLTLWVSV